LAFTNEPAKAMAVVVAYDMYLECAEGKLERSWKVKKPLDFWSFREKLSEQMLAYNPTKRLYPGDHLLRKATQQCKHIRLKAKVQREKEAAENPPDTDNSKEESSEEEEDYGTTKKEYRTIVKNERRMETRICGDLNKFEAHCLSVSLPKDQKHPKQCRVCGKECYTECTLCTPACPLHYFPNRGSNSGKICFVEWHNRDFFGLARDDCGRVNKRKTDWIAPTSAEKLSNSRRIKRADKR